MSQRAARVVKRQALSARPAPEFPLGAPLEFLQRLWRLNHALERRSYRMEQRYGVTAQQRFIVRCVGKYPGITAGQLAGLLHIDPGTLSATLRRLEQKKIVERRKHPRDKRRVTLGLTKKGRDLSQVSHGTVEDAVARMLEVIPASRAAIALEVIERFTDSLEQTTVPLKTRR